MKYRISSKIKGDYLTENPGEIVIYFRESIDYGLDGESLVNVSDIPIEETAVYKMCEQLATELIAQEENEYNEELKLLHSKTRGALAIKVERNQYRTRVSFTYTKPTNAV